MEKSLSCETHKTSVVNGLGTYVCKPPSQMLPALLDGKNADAMVWADSAYQSKRVDSFLKEAGYESRIQEKGSRHDPLATAAKERNRERSKTRAKVEHVFGQMEMVMGGKLTRCIGLARLEG